MDEAEVKKECPSCGLGVALDATICEFCGWDFEEEDEWILQIEKLERDLMLEKQKFEPGTVDQMIESTLHAPLLERPDATNVSQEAKPASTAQETPVREPTQTAPSSVPVSMPREVARAPQVALEKTKTRRVRVVKGEPAPMVDMEGISRSRRIRTVKAAPTEEGTKETQEKRSRGVIGGLFFSKEEETEQKKLRRVRRSEK